MLLVTDPDRYSEDLFVGSSEDLFVGVHVESASTSRCCEYQSAFRLDVSAHRLVC